MNPMAAKEKSGGTDLAKNAPGLMATVEELLLVEVVESGGYRAASERTGIPLSSISRRVTALEDRLGVCVIMRNSRCFEVTDIGRQLFEQGIKIREAAHAAVSAAQEPSGDLRIAMPHGTVDAVGVRGGRQVRAPVPPRAPVPEHHPGHAKGLGAELRHRDPPQLPGAARLGVVAQQLIQVPYNLCASPQLLQGRETSGAPSALAEPDSIGRNSGESQTCWTLQDPQGRTEELRLSVRFVTDNLLAVKEAAIAGLGITRQPTALAAPSVAEGSLRQMLPRWSLAPMTIYALYPRGGTEDLR